MSTIPTWKAILAAAAATVFCTAAGDTAPLRIPFDFSRSEIGIAVSVKGKPLYMLLDTGVDPSTIDLARAEALHMKVDRKAGAKPSGTGEGSHALAYPAMIEGLAISGRDFAPVNAIAIDLGALSARYGRPLDGVLGFSFLNGKTVLFDYPAHVVQILGQAADADALTRSCKARWAADLRFAPGNWPMFPAFRFGGAKAPVSLDTGSNSILMLYPGARDLPGMRAALVQKGESPAAGFGGKSVRPLFILRTPIGFGPFVLPPGAQASLNATGYPGVVANAGNKLFAGLKLKMLLDYRTHRMTFFGNCS